MTRFINGKAVNNLPDFIGKNDIIDAVNENRPNRIVLMKTYNGFKKIDANKKYIPNEAQLKIAPDRIKAFSYNGNKSDLTKQIIYSQAKSISEKIFPNVEIDSNYDWIRINDYRLPIKWREVNQTEVVSLLIVIPDEFPSLPPNGFYLPKNVNSPYGAGHFFDPGFGGSHVGESQRIRKVTDRWKWYCSMIDPNAWSPAPIQKISDWRKGDNLFDILYLINNVLMDPFGD